MKQYWGKIIFMKNQDTNELLRPKPQLESPNLTLSWKIKYGCLPFIGASLYFLSYAFLFSRTSFSFKNLIWAWFFTLFFLEYLDTNYWWIGSLLEDILSFHPSSFTSLCIKLNLWSQFMTIFKVFSVGALKPPWLLREMNSRSLRTPRGRSSCNILK